MVFLLILDLLQIQVLFCWEAAELLFSERLVGSVNSQENDQKMVDG